LRIKIDVIRIVIAVVPTRRLQTEANTCAPRGSKGGAVAACGMLDKVAAARTIIAFCNVTGLSVPTLEWV
jgi:hypothetical protein